jgi:hypothetical protein
MISDDPGEVERRRNPRRSSTGRRKKRRNRWLFEAPELDSFGEEIEDVEAVPTEVAARRGVDGVVDTVKVCPVAMELVSHLQFLCVEEKKKEARWLRR